MLITADGGTADKHILKADVLIYPSCYWRSLMNVNVSNADFVQMLQSSEFLGLLCFDDLCRYSIVPFSLSFVLHLQKREKKKKRLQLHSQSNRRSRIAVGSSPPPDLNPITPSTYIKYIKFVLKEKKDPLCIKTLSR